MQPKRTMPWSISVLHCDTEPGYFPSSKPAIYHLLQDHIALWHFCRGIYCFPKVYGHGKFVKLQLPVRWALKL